MTKISNKDGDLFKMVATAKRVRRSGKLDMAEVKINKMAGKAEIQFKKKKREKKDKFAWKSFSNTAKCYRTWFCCSLFLFCYFKVRSNGFERTRLRNTVPLFDSMLLNCNCLRTYTLEWTYIFVSRGFRQ